MGAPFTNVTFEFRLPPALMLLAQPGDWNRSPRGAVLNVGRDGSVAVTSFDRHESFARNQVLKVAAAFLRTVDDRLTAHLLIATLFPGNGDRAIRYSIALGARVSITPTLTQAELIAGDDVEQSLNVAAR
jgi:hypothetical protein